MYKLIIIKIRICSFKILKNSFSKIQFFYQRIQFPLISIKFLRNVNDSDLHVTFIFIIFTLYITRQLQQMCVYLYSLRTFDNLTQFNMNYNL